MLKMGELAGYFTLEFRKYINENLDDFMWEGANLYLFKNRNNDNFECYLCENMEYALGMAEKKMTIYDAVIVRNNVTRELFHIK